MLAKSGQALLALTLSALFAQQAQAQTAPATAADFAGPSTPGVCLLSREALYVDTKVGKAAAARLQQLQAQVQSSLVASRTAIEASAKALEAQRASLPPAQLAEKERALNKRAQGLQATASERSQQLETTRNHALQLIDSDAKPAMAAAYKAHACGVLFDRASVIAGGAAMDITDEVVRALDASVTTIDFDLEPTPAAALSR
jgi:Skp family chaperone for outer membrane proteins